MPPSAERLTGFVERLRVPPGRKVRLGSDFDPSDKADFVDRKAGKSMLKQGVRLLARYQARLAAQDTHGVLVCLHALDAGGKDGTIVTS
jgi:polyphosphate kinase 2 (PPK2 family)